jgi:hypothetical protein
MEGFLKQDLYSEFEKALKDARNIGTGFIKITVIDETTMNIDHIPPEHIQIAIPDPVRCPDCLRGGDWCFEGECVRCGYKTTDRT